MSRRTPVADDLVQPDERAQIAADLRHHWPTQIECLAAADQIEADAAEIERLRAEVAARTESGQIVCLADIREAVGDPTGKLMQDELVALVRELAALRERVERAPAFCMDSRSQALRAVYTVFDEHGLIGKRVALVVLEE
jgi:HAMP domain-containing protein